MKKSLLICFILLSLGCASTQTGGSSSGSIGSGFSFSFDNPKVKVIIPEIPQIKMGPHPMAARGAHLRYMGSADLYNLSILTPTADPGMTAMDCAQSIISGVVQRFGLKQDQYAVFQGLDKKTFAVFYSIKVLEFSQMNAHLVSSAAGKYCIEVHVSKMTSSEAEAKDWNKGMPNARIIENP
ncbi:hypothetical protein [Leptospira sarikeiensis]|uniref:Lipoprotein n=1 Tax=Leptospira sarikeiensis TaxID=2484943 RepID=A0A4R9K5Q3_9LEPT|nr:hypothetical protein [Leptospira sarikeiensis]TGL60531.1 hypothetical protein EHQ64_11895 [Leptospira sarikeiensis]